MKDDEPKLSDLIGPDHKLRAGVEEMVRNVGLLCKAAETQAKIRRAAYNASIKQGFTKEQALVLCTRPIG